MQNLDVISVNLWQILISLANLVILFLLVKKLFYKPVKRILKEREDEINVHYFAAEQAESDALKSKAEYEEALSDAKAEADGIIKDAAEKAKRRSDTIIDEAEQKASRIVRQAEQDAVLEREKATDSIKREIIEVSSALSEKLIQREINADDHKALIDSFIEEIGDGNE
ncbi:MAG: F0F1 ATP synthase subunit B [Clostridia bacterium]|nr:F0F1 ATP synthase subunit B [Clostridia bacterium]